ncbi:MAG: molybdopterin-dependent oxidoreductase, partial [Dehalococcoidia bacterium]|nr:molybdopterin-dependent oxidoreductase [Dehalococcoidia bacterium]
SGKVTVWSTTQGVFLVQSGLSESLWMPMTKIRVIGTSVGGAFGGKFEICVEGLAVVLARKANRPVKILLTREEELTATRVRHPSIITMKTGVKKDGTLLARDVRLIYDTGAFAEDGPTIVGNATVLSRGPYRIPNIHVHGYCVYTNKVISGAFRGYGDPQVTFAYESQMDIIARKLGIDPLEIRLKNMIETGDKMAHGQELLAVGLKKCLLQAAEKAEWGKRTGENRGKGISLTQHGSGLLSSCAFVRLNEDGTVTLQIGAIDLGSGSNTTLAQVAAEELGVSLDNVAVVSADTDSTPYDYATCADRVAYTAGNAVKLAAADAKKQLLERAAGMMEAKAEDLEIKESKIFVKGSPDKSMSMFDMGIACHYFAGGPILGKGSYLARGRPFDANVMKGHPMGPHASF